MNAASWPEMVTNAATLLFTLLPIVLVGLFAWGVRHVLIADGRGPADASRSAFRAVAIALVWMIATSGTAQNGLLRQWQQRPPPFAFVIAGTIVLAGVIAFGRIGRLFSAHLPLWVLVASQAFRLPLELAMHRMYEIQVMPIQMSYSGRNWDIATGISALVVAALVRQRLAGRRLVLAWNAAGMALLVNVMVVAILGTPVFAYFGPEHLNVWVAYAPFVWLPAVMVLAALAGHLVIFRAVLGRWRNTDRVGVH